MHACVHACMGAGTKKLLIDVRGHLTMLEAREKNDDKEKKEINLDLSESFVNVSSEGKKGD